MASWTVFDQNGRVCLNGFSERFKSIIWINSFNFPCSFICFLCGSAYLLKSRRIWMEHWSFLNRLQIKLLRWQVSIRNEVNFLSKMNNVILIPIVFISSFNYENSSCVRSSYIWTWIALICVFSRWYFVAKIYNKTGISLLVWQHNFVSESQQAIRRVSLWNFLQSSREIHLCLRWFKIHEIFSFIVVNDSKIIIAYFISSSSMSSYQFPILHLTLYLGPPINCWVV